MHLFTVIMPTTAHRETIRYAIMSVLDQTCADFRLVVIGDGCPPRTLEIVQSFSDDRVSMVEHPKSEGTGEEYRDLVVRYCPAPFIAYLEDDDLWAQDHLERMAALLANADFCHGQMAHIQPDEQIQFQRGDLRHPHIKAAMLGASPFNVAALGTVAHTRDSYLRLPVGWSTRPPGWWSDLWMWRKWLAEDWVRIGSEPSVTFLHMQAAYRDDWSPLARMNEAAHWYYRSRSPGFRTWIDRQQASALVGAAGDWVQAAHNLEGLRASLATSQSEDQG